MINKIYCNNCGKEIPIGSKFCRLCGNQQIESGEEKLKTKENGYFISHWKFLFSILGPAFIHSLLYGLFIAVAFFVIEIIASLFGYCITAKGQKCLETGAEIIYIPLAIGGFYFVYGAFSVMKRALIVIAQSPELKLIFGLLDKPRNAAEYFSLKGINTLFMPKYFLLISAFLLLMLTKSSLTTIVTTLGVIIVFSDLKILRWLFITLLKLNQYKLEQSES